ncbi:hypothetical protein R3W88_002972 [Solanum pinnatisectum]|uniref:Uncharacterized protein n=1 Tax=Solanum pinnatisectum TaxID=50273 RepID=A0AAV9MQF1_9SOLN|nr:hypothetical protein R3W88_002972 [Solanum pinnatisectum]
MDEHSGINDISVDDVEGDAVSDSDNEVSSPGRHGLDSLKDRQLSVEYLEDECDVMQDVDDLDGKTLLWVKRSFIRCSSTFVYILKCCKFQFSHLQQPLGKSIFTPWKTTTERLHKTPDLAYDLEERAKLRHKPLEDGQTIIYAPTRKETLSISKFLSKFGTKTAAYNAKVHKEFHESTLQPRHLWSTLAITSFWRNFSSSMYFNNITFAIISFTSSFLLYLPILRKRQKMQIAAEKLRIITQALEQAEDRVLRYEERHDNILKQICSHYIVSQEIVEALAGAREVMNEALEFAITLRNLQLEIIRLYADDYESASRPVWFIGKSRRQRNNNN